jgi:hypothetical protein
MKVFQLLDGFIRHYPVFHSIQEYIGRTQHHTIEQDDTGLRLGTEVVLGEDL